MYGEKNLTLKILITTATDYVLTFLLYFLEKIRLSISYESMQMKYKVLSLKNNKTKIECHLLQFSFAL